MQIKKYVATYASRRSSFDYPENNNNNKLTVIANSWLSLKNQASTAKANRTTPNVTDSRVAVLQLAAHEKLVQ